MDEKLKILLCEDDENLGMLLREYLQAKGYSAELCPDGDAGYKAFAKSKFDICVLDVMMPKKDGFTLAQEIRQSNAEIPIIFLTAKTLKEDILEGFKIGADDFTFTDEDFADFKRMVLESGFTYDRLSDKRLQDLKKVAQFEGYYEDAKAEFDALEAKLKHNLSAELDRHEESLRPLVTCELIKHYFFQAGSIQESLKDDPDVAKAAEILEDKVEYDRILKGQKGQ